MFNLEGNSAHSCGQVLDLEFQSTSIDRVQVGKLVLIGTDIHWVLARD